MNPGTTTTIALALVLAASPATPCQDPAREPPVVLELLLRQPRRFDAAALRQAAETAFDVELPVESAGDAEEFVVEDGGMGIVRIDGVTMLVHSPPVPRFLHRRAAAMACRDPAVAAAIRDHRSYATIMAVGDAVDVAERRRRVARLGAALLDEEVLAVGFSEADAFVAPAEDLPERLCSDEPMAALTPLRGAAGILLLASTAKPDREALEAALAKIAPGERPAVRSEDEGRRLAATADGVSFALILCDDEVHVAPSRDYHPAVLAELVVMAELDTGDPTRLAVEQRWLAQVLLAQIAARPQGDVLAFTLTPAPAIPIPATEAALLEVDDPFAAARRWASDPITHVADDDPAMVAAIAQARETFDRLRRRFATHPDAPCYVKYPIHDGEHTEHFWVAVTAIDDEQVRGTLANEPVLVRGPKFRDAVEVPIAEISDWMYMDGDERVGGFSVAVLMARTRRLRGR